MIIPFSQGISCYFFAWGGVENFGGITWFSRGKGGEGLSRRQQSTKGGLQKIDC